MVWWYGEQGSVALMRTAPLQLVAHRGDPVHEIENTLAAVRRARADGAALIEVDLRRTADGECVLLHDPTSLRMWGVDRPVREQRTAELAPGIPLLRDALVEAAPSALLLDLPDDGPDPLLAHAVVDTVRAVRAADPSVPAPSYCGGLTAMRAVRASEPSAEIRLTWKVPEPIPDEILVELRPRSWNPPHELVDAASIAWARAHGLEVTCWTVDDARRAEELAVLGVDAITSNRAGALRRELGIRAR